MHGNSVAISVPYLEDRIVDDILIKKLGCVCSCVYRAYSCYVTRFYQKSISGQELSQEEVINGYLIDFYYRSESISSKRKTRPVESLVIVPLKEDETVPEEIIEEIKEELRKKNKEELEGMK